MEENLRTRLLLGLIILNVIFILLWVTSCGNVRKYQSARNKEMDIRLDAEKKLDDVMRTKAVLEDKVKKAQEELAQLQASFDSDKKSLTQQQMINNSLKTELEKLNKLKQTLEEDLKDTLLRCKSSDKMKK